MKSKLGSICLIVAAIWIFFYLGKLLTLKAPEYMMMDDFYNENAELIDVLCIGSSHAYTSCNTEVYWNEYGIPVYCISSPSQPAGVSYYYFQEALKYSKPKVLLLELSTANSAWVGGEYHYGVAVTSLKQGFNRWMITLKGAPEELKTSLISNLDFYHNRWNSLTHGDYEYLNGNKRHNTHGFDPWWSYSKYNDEIISYNTDKKAEPDADAIEYIEKILSVCEKENIKPVIYISPHLVGEATYQGYNWWRDFFEGKGIDFIDGIQLTDELQIVAETDNTNGHVSYYGAKKISHYIGDFLMKKEYVSDHRGQREYDRWGEDANYYCQYEEQFDLENYNNDLESYISHVADMNDVAVIILYSGKRNSNILVDNSVLNDNEISLSLDSEKPYIGVFCNGKSVYESQNERNEFEGCLFESDIQISVTNSDKGNNVIIDYNRITSINENQETPIKIYVYSYPLNRCIDIREF